MSRRRIFQMSTSSIPRNQLTLQHLFKRAHRRICQLVAELAGRKGSDRVPLEALGSEGGEEARVVGVRRAAAAGEGAPRVAWLRWLREEEGGENTDRYCALKALNRTLARCSDSLLDSGLTETETGFYTHSYRPHPIVVSINHPERTWKPCRDGNGAQGRL